MYGFTRDERGGFFYGAGREKAKNLLGPQIALGGNLGITCEALSSRGTCKPLFSFLPWLSYCFIMAFLKWEN